MTKQTDNHERTRLGNLLRREAMADRPEFDEKLHARVMEAVDPWHNPVEMYAAPPRSWTAKITDSAWLPVSLAAALMVALGIFVVRNADPGPPQIYRVDSLAAKATLLSPGEVPGKVIDDQVPESPSGMLALPFAARPGAVAFALRGPLNGFSVRTSRIPAAAAERLSRLEQANKEYANSLIKDQLANIDQDARTAANRWLDKWQPESTEEAPTPAPEESNDNVPEPTEN